MNDLLSTLYGLEALIIFFLLLDVAGTAAVLFKAARDEDIQEVDFEGLISAKTKVRVKDSKCHFSRNFETSDCRAPAAAGLTIGGKGQAVLTTCAIGDDCMSTRWYGLISWDPVVSIQGHPLRRRGELGLLYQRPGQSASWSGVGGKV